MKYIFIIVTIFFLISCNKESTNKKNENNVVNVSSIENSDSTTNMIDANVKEEEKAFSFLKDEEIKKIISENVFYGINTEPDYYINNNEYTVEYNFEEEDSYMGIAQDTYSIWVYNDYIRIAFANRMLISVYITKKTDIHFLGKYIGENINEVDELFGDVYRWQQDRSHSYSIINNDIAHFVQLLTINKDSEIINGIEVGVSGILSSGRLPKIEKE